MRRLQGRGAALAASLVALWACADATEPVSGPPPLPEAHGLAGMDLPVQEQYRELRAELERALAAPDAKPEEIGEAYGRLGMWGHTYRDWDLARAGYTRAVAAAPEDFRWLYYLGMVEIRRDPKAAREALVRVLTLRPEHPQTLVRLGELELEEGRPEAARGWFQRALDVQPRSARALFGLGLVALQTGDPAHAARRLEAALAIAPEASGVQYALGLAYRKLGDERRAQKHLRRVDARDPEATRLRPALRDPLARALGEFNVGSRSARKRAQRALDAGEAERAIAILRDAIARGLDSASLRSVLAKALLEAGDIEGARAVHEENIRLHPGYVHSHLSLGRMNERRGPRGSGEPHFRKALEVDPENAEANFAVALMELYAGRHDEARALFDRAIALQPDRSEMRIRRAHALLFAGRWEDAAAALQSDREALPDELMLRVLEARLLAAAPDPALRDGRRSLGLAREDLGQAPPLFVAETLAMAHAELGDLDRAVAWQRAALAAVEEGDRERTPWVAERLTLYESGRPSRSPVLADERLREKIRVSPPAT